MNEEKQTKIKKLLFKLSGVFPDRKLSTEGINTYCEFLVEYDVTILTQAVKECVKTLRFFPTIAEITEKVQPFLAEQRKAVAAIAEQSAYDKQKEICKANVYKGGGNYLTCRRHNFGCRDSHTPLCPMVSGEFNYLLQGEKNVA